MQCTPFSSLTHPSPLPLHPTTPSNKQHSINTPIHLTIIRHLRPPAPHDLPPRRHDPQLADIDLDDGPLGQHPELRVQRVLRVFFDGDDGQLDGDAEFGVGDVGFFVAEAHGADEAFVFDGAAGEAGADEGGFGYHAFPAGVRMLVLGGTQDGGEGMGGEGEKGEGWVYPFFAVFFPVFTTLNISSSLMPFTFGNGTLNFAAFSARLFLICELSALALFVVWFLSKRYDGKGVDEGSAGAKLDLTLRSSCALICFFIWIFSAWRFLA